MDASLEANHTCPAVIRVAIIVFFLNSFLHINAQVDTALFIPEIEITASRLELFHTGQAIQFFTDSILEQSPASNLADILLAQSGLTIKTYGQGGLATPGIRGTGASHTAVLWNGFNMQNSMNGVVDLALFPLDLIDQAVIQYGGASALFGSGAIGGVVHLKDHHSSKSGIHGRFIAGFGSFGDYRQSAKVSFHRPAFSSAIKMYNQQAHNNFPLYSGSRPKQTHARVGNTAVGQHNTIRINKNQQLSTHFWWQNTNRQIPSSLTEGNSDAQQEDDILRAAITWQYLINQSIIKFRTAFFDERLLFFSSLADSSLSHMQTLYLEGETSFSPTNRQLINIGVHYGNHQAKANFFETKKMRQILALYISYRLAFSDKWRFSSNLRQELADGEAAPFTASIGMDGHLNNHWVLRSKLSKNHRLPNFNDLYWPGAGNPALRSETGWSKEFGLEYQQKLKKGHWQSGITAFSILVDDWILWAPNTKGLWTPENKRKVWSRGLEYLFKAHYNPGNWQFDVALNYDLTFSTIREIYNGQEVTERGKQLIYIPVHKGNFLLKMSYGDWWAQYQQFVYGRRFTSPDNEQSLPPIGAGDLSFAWSKSFKSIQPRIQFTIHNIWNVDYQLIAWRPMPLRHVQLRIGLEW